MSNNKLTKEKIQQLLSALASRPLEDNTQVQAEEYNWHQPHCFTHAQHNKLEDYTKKISKMIDRRFNTLCHGDFGVTITSTSQHFANELINEALESRKNDYYLAFGPNQEHPCGFVNIPIETALIWATQLLGDTPSKDDSRVDMSQLEESLLLDIASAIVDALSESHAECNFQPAKTIVKRLLPFELEGAEEFYKITFNVNRSDSDDTEAHILIFCDNLEPVAGKAIQTGNLPAEDVSKAVLDRLHQMPVSITARVDSVMISFDEAMALQPGDVLLLDKKADEPIELLVEGRPLFYCRPAKSIGRYAVVITERQTEN
jgi:flagellar motor switch protein FliM